MTTSIQRLSPSGSRPVDKFDGMFYICSMSGLHLVWFREDLRVHDHAALRAAVLMAERDGGRVLPFFLLPDEAGLDDALSGALRDLDHALEQRGAALHYRGGDLVSCLTDLHAGHEIASLHIHAPIAELPVDQQVETWCLRAGVPLRIHQQFAVSQSDWNRFMSAPRHEAPAMIPAANVGIGSRPDTEIGSGGRKAAIKWLREALGQVSDLSQIGNPERAESATLYEQLHASLSFGVLSVREIWQAAISSRQHFVAAGHEIQAARIDGLIEPLRQFGLKPASPRPARNPAAPQKPDGQLSLDFDSRRAV